LALAALALVLFGAYDSNPEQSTEMKGVNAVTKVVQQDPAYLIELLIFMKSLSFKLPH